MAESTTKPKGWFSRRYPTNQQHKAATERYRLLHTPIDHKNIPVSEMDEPMLRAQWDLLDARRSEGCHQGAHAACSPAPGSPSLMSWQTVVIIVAGIAAVVTVIVVALFYRMFKDF
jgi:hypothetical protein